MASTTIAPWAEPVPDVDRPVSADELLSWPEDPDFPWQYELVEGRIVRMPPPGLEHSDVIQTLFIALRAFVRSLDLGVLTMPETGYQLYRSPDGKTDVVLAPDIGFIGSQQLGRLPSRGTPDRKKHVPVAPDLAVEVASPDQYRPELAKKAQLYLAWGTRLVWVVWPGRRQVDVWQAGADKPVATLGIGDQLDGGGIIPGFTFPVAGLFG